ncbi:MAG: MerC domain-containing protein [Myxococcota bacterium]|nr:MerC domain-containing protein [Myxococcota bacterium]
MNKPLSPVAADTSPLRWVDRLGGLASSLCAVHCALVGFAPSIATVLGLAGAVNEKLEWGFFGAAMLLAGVAAAVGFRKHGSWAVLGVFSGGLALLLLGRMSETFALFEGGGVLSIVGGFTLLGAHLLSLRRRASEP